MHQHHVIAACLRISINNNVQRIDRRRERLLWMIVGSAEKTTVLEESSLTCFTDSLSHFLCRISTTIPILSIENSSRNSLQDHHSGLVGALLDGRRYRVTPERHPEG